MIKGSMAKRIKRERVLKEPVLYIVMPAYNEEGSIKDVIDSWYKVIKKHDGNGKSRLVVVNDGSKDNTYEVAKELEKKYDKLVVLTKKNSGHGPTVIYAYNYAIKSGADLVFQTDSDGQTNPMEFEKFWNDRLKYDAIFGYRKVRGDGEKRAMVEKVVCLLVKTLFGVSVPDANAPFRLMAANYLAKYLKKLPKDFNLPNIMLTTYFTYYKNRVDFKVITFKPRTKGINSINMKRIFKIGYKAMFDFLKLRKDM